jgi:CrcB protein
VRSLLAVAVGALVGTALRLGLDTAIPHSDDGFPTSTLIINVLGSFALGLLVARVWPVASTVVKAALGPGLIGSFTTFSAFAVSLVSLVAHNEVLVAGVYLLVTLLGGYAAAWAGLRIGRRPEATS